MLGTAPWPAKRFSRAGQGAVGPLGRLRGGRRIDGVYPCDKIWRKDSGFEPGWRNRQTRQT